MDKKPISRNSAAKIVVVDDCKELLSIHCAMLEIAGFEAEGVASGTEALLHLASADKPDLIILDYCLGDMSGLEFLEQLEKDRPDIYKDVPVVYLTGLDHIESGKAAGLIRKPAEMNSFIESVHHYVEQGRLK